MDLARVAATRATCPRLSVGAALVRDRRVLSLGYNGAPTGHDHCATSGCLMPAGHCVRSVHAEVNAVLHAAKSGVSTAGATLYVTHRPCWDCYRLLANAGVSRAVYAADYGSAYPATGPGPQLEQLT